MLRSLGELKSPPQIGQRIQFLPISTQNLQYGHLM